MVAPAPAAFPLWTPDGERIVFASNRQGADGIYWKAADGTGDVEPLGSIQGQLIFPASWSGDGKTMIFHGQLESRNVFISALSIEGDRSWESLLNDKYHVTTPQISPDGRWMAYVSLESGMGEVYVCPFPDVTEGKWQISTNIGGGPIWSPDGRELFYLSNDAVMAVSVETDPTFTHEKAKTLFAKPDIDWSYADMRPWDISPDGRRFLMIKPTGKAGEGSVEQTQQQIDVVVNWVEKFR